MHATLERPRVSTGYGPLDEVLRGGYPDSYAFILSSPSCDERDLLLRRFLESEAEGGLSICLTRDFGEVADLAAAYPDSYAVVCHVPELVSGMRNVFQIPWYDDLFSVNIAVSSILQRVGPHLSGRWPKKLVIDLISDMLLSRRAVTTRSWLWDLIARMKARRFTILGVFNPEMHPTEDAQAIIELFDGHISIEQRESDGGSRRLARVRKMYAFVYDRSYVELDCNDLMGPPRHMSQSESYPQSPLAHLRVGTAFNSSSGSWKNRLLIHITENRS